MDNITKLYKSLLKEFPDDLSEIFNFLLVATGARKAYLLENLDYSLTDLKTTFAKLAPNYDIKCVPEHEDRRFLFYQEKYQKHVDELFQNPENHDLILGELLEFDCPGDLVYNDSEATRNVRLMVNNQVFMVYICRLDNFNEEKLVSKVKKYKELADKFNLKITYYVWDQLPRDQLYLMVLQKKYDEMIKNYKEIANIYNNYYITPKAGQQSRAYQIMMRKNKKEIEREIKFLQVMMKLSFHWPFEVTFDPATDSWEKYNKFLYDIETMVYKFYSV